MTDTEFLFGMRNTDPKHEDVKAILEELERVAPAKRKELVLPVAALFELVVVLLSQGKPPRVIIETLKLLKDISSRYGLEVLRLDFDQLVEGMSVYASFGRTLFDALIAGSALGYDKTVIGDDQAFLTIPNVSRRTLTEYLSYLQKK